jgi:PPM family protein phosphatase
MTNITEFISAAVTDRGLNEGRPHNEDSYIEMPQFGLFAVADGVGGAQAGEVASQMAVEILGEAFANMHVNADPEETMRLALLKANDAIFQMSNDLPQLSTMATTIVAIHVHGDMVTIGHVGDSRVYRLDEKARLIRETEDHSVVEEEVRAGRMTPEQALNHPSRNVISRALGADQTVQPDIKCVLIRPGTTFLLCSDGITRHISDDELTSLLHLGGQPAEICARMKAICFERGAEDNLTAVIVEFPGEREKPFEDPDIEESTAAAAREPAVPQFAAAGFNPLDDDGPAQAFAETEQLHAYDPGRPAHFGDTPVQEAVGTVPSPVESNVFTYPGVEDEIRVPDPKPSLAVMLGLLAFGIVLGLAGGYLITRSYQPVAEAPVITEQKSNNVPLTSFEETRRLVDADPGRYLNANAASPQDSADYFWLGRALLMTGKPVEAKRAFEESRRRLTPTSDPENFRTLSNEITMGLLIAEDPAAVEALARSVAEGRPPDGNLNSTAPVR